MGQVNPAGGSGSDEGRDSWCTPYWVAELIGRVRLDPCGNERSHIEADHVVDLALGGNGLSGCPTEPSVVDYNCVGSFFQRSPKQLRAESDWSVFCNPPYARGQVARWVKHYRHTRFIFLLRWDPSTNWFSGLLPYCTHVWFPDRRINFEPPPGVKSSSNPFPHALYLSCPSKELLERLRPHGYLLDVGQQTNHNISHEAKRIRRDDKVSGGSGAASLAALKRGEQASLIDSPKEQLGFPKQWCEYIDTTPRPAGCQHDSCGLCGT